MAETESKGGLTLLSYWVSGFCHRCLIALSEKGLEYEYREENILQSKSPLLIKSNPVHEKVPVLIHDGKPICESLVIVVYIDEAWPDRSPLLPADPAGRARARFWADFVDEKVYDCGLRLWRLKWEEQEAAKREFVEILKLLEAELGEKRYFGGDTFGFVDVALAQYLSWFYTYETCAGLNIEEAAPKLMTWGRMCVERESVATTMPDPRKIYDFVCSLKKKFGIE